MVDNAEKATDIPESIFYKNLFFIPNLRTNKSGIEYKIWTKDNDSIESYLDEEQTIFDYMEILGKYFTLLSSSKVKNTLTAEKSTLNNIDKSKYFYFTDLGPGRPQRPIGDYQIRIHYSIENDTKSKEYRQAIIAYLKKYLDFNHLKFSYYRNIANVGLNYLKMNPTVLPEQDLNIFNTILNRIQSTSNDVVNDINIVRPILSQSPSTSTADYENTILTNFNNSLANSTTQLKYFLAINKFGDRRKSPRR
jgi:hypothetical protein